MQSAELILWPFLEEAPFASAMFDTQMCYLRASRGWRQDYGLGDRPLRAFRTTKSAPKFQSVGRKSTGRLSTENFCIARKIVLNVPTVLFCGCVGTFVRGTPRRVRLV